MNYLVISPVKDEERHVEKTLRSMVGQSVKPIRWIIVEDGSTDGTLGIIERYAREHPFIHVVRTPPGQARQPGAAVIRAFNCGFEEAKRLGVAYDLIVKLDCDLSFDPDYFEQLIARFKSDNGLGIASGIYFETANEEAWHEIPMPSYHAAGASKVIRAECWREIDGFVASRGWDTVDEIRAMSRGWRTTHFPELHMKHWKKEGAGIGVVRTSAMHGEIYYLTGGGILFFALKVIHRLKARPVGLGAAAMAWGYVRALLSGRERLVTRNEAQHYRALLNQRLTGRLTLRKEGNQI
ncbi:MAG: glycosyltransferase family 2 protein [Bryobacteraceae bacterium]|nr:glycosyltransferase family 2 protein [Bryobacteraceae bacterium]